MNACHISGCSCFLNACRHLKGNIQFFLLLLLAVLSGSTAVMAQTISFPVREESGYTLYGNTLVANPALNVLYVANDKRSDMLSSPAAFSAAVKYKSNNTLVKFGVNHAAIQLPTAAYVYKLVYKLEGSKTMDNAAYAPKSVTDTLVIGYNPDSLSPMQDLQVKVYPGFYNAKLSVVALYDITNNTAAPVAINFPVSSGPTNFFIDLSMQYQAYSKYPYDPADLGLSTSHTYLPASQALKVSWTPQHPTAYIDKVTPAQYELEWTYVDDYPASGTTPLSSADLRYNFKNNATRIITDSPNYSIPVVYPRGYLIYRVRMVRVDSILYQTPIYGVWSGSAQSGAVSSAANAYYISAPHTNDALNWNYTISFAEGGKYKHVVSYFDGLLKNRQTITRFNTNPNQLLVTENIYDYEGRPSITTIPSVVDTNLFSYQKGMSISSATNAPYAAIDFDKKPTACPENGTVIPAFTNASLANRYYSTLNTDTSGLQRFVPQAKGYPFVHTQLSPGFSDRVDRMGGAGDKLQIATGHETENEYVNADQPDLNQLFGINAGYKNFYNKTVSKDPNGQLSMSVKDYEGKLMTTSLIGASLDTSKIAILYNEEVPGAQKFTDEQLARSPQLTVGHQRIYNGSFFMDRDANIKVKYEYTFRPFQVCPAPNYLGLTVAGNYDYSIIDHCGDSMLHHFNTLGTTGVTTNPSDKTVADSANVSLGKGKFTLDKTLSVNTDDIYAAVDSFFAHKPNCARTEDEFIREEVEKAKFPCPGSLLDPCAQLAKTMMEELFSKDLTNNPGYAGTLSTGKYGTFTRLGGANHHLFTGMTPSIFDINRYSDYDTGTYRYQYPCVASDLNRLVVNVYGNYYNGLGSLPVDTFEFIYEHAPDSSKYAIARALLPLHPEYCRLAGCFADTFETRLNSIPNASIAEKYGYFNLNDIVDKDIQLRQKLLQPAINMVHISDSLKVMLGGYVRMDTFAAEMAFCLNDDSLVFGNAKSIFHDDIVALNFPSMAVKDVYFQKLRAFYFNNRAKYKSIAQTGGGNACEPCAAGSRMALRPPPLVTVIYNNNGSLNTGPDGMLSLFSGSMQASILASASGGYTIQDPAHVAQQQDSAVRGMQRIDSTLSYIAVDTVMGRLINCYNAPGDSSLLRSKLIAMVVNKEVHNGLFQPDQLRAAIVAAGLSLNDLCHPYLNSYDYFDDGLGAKGSCSSGSFYNSVKDFLNGGVVFNALSNAASAPVAQTIQAIDWDHSNPFAGQVLAQLHGAPNTAVELRTTYDALRKRYRISFYHNGGTDTVQISLRSPVDIMVGSTAYPLLSPQPAGSTILFSNVSCYFEDPQAYAEGHIGRFEFRAAVDRTDGTQNTRTEMLGWNNGKIYMNEAGGGNSIASCVPCTQFKAIYKAFADSMKLYAGYAADHPLFYKSMRSFMNYSLKKVFTEDQYSRFLQSCALADSMDIPMYGGYAQRVFSGIAHFNSVKQQVQSLFGFTLKTSVNYLQGNKQYTIIDYRNIPYNLLRKAGDMILDNSTPDETSADIMGTLIVPASVGAALNSLVAQSGFTNDAGVQVTDAATQSSYTKYELTASPGTSFSNISRGIASIQQGLYDQNIQGYWIPVHFATVNADYYKPEKQGLLSYTYGLEQMPGITTPKILDTLQDYLLKSNVAAFAGSDVSYSDPANPYRFTNLYYTSASNVYPGYQKLKNILGYAQGTLGSNAVFLASNAPNNTRIGTGNPGGSALTLYRCSDGLYWYRYFDTDNKLYNVYVRIPSYIFRDAQPGYRPLSGAPGSLNVIPANGDSATRRFTLKLTNGTDTIMASGSADFDLAWSNKLSDVLLGAEDNYKQEDPLSGEAGAPLNCEQQLLENAVYAGRISYIHYIDSFRVKLKASFYAHVMSQIREKLWIEYMDQRFATTLYNYDLAGNLIQTVPPEGVHKLTGTALARVDGLRDSSLVAAIGIPAHTKSTRYEYNTVNKPLTETTPDAGQKTLYYNAKGNVIASQSAKQRSQGTFTYMLYDRQNRLTETGETHWGSCAGFADIPSYTRNGSGQLVRVAAPPCACENTRDSLWQYCLSGLFDPYIRSYDSAGTYAAMIKGMPRTQVVVSVYDSALTDLSAKAGMSKQENLRSRIAANLYYENCAANQNYAFGFVHATHYSYDITGNVQTLVQDFPELDGMQQRYKRVDYEYDLLSGKVNMIAYNRGGSDQFYQRYRYDADNRITMVQTSHDGIIWKRDAEYSYYKHGPLARISIGDQRVQGVDYAYTLQGWLKKINGDYADRLSDMGGDGSANAITPKDVFATNITYFANDYAPVGSQLPANFSALPTPAKSLYNGNIARQTTEVAQFGGMTGFYTYDQLNRIRKADYAIRNGDQALTFGDFYASTYKYDQDGNLKALTRKDGAGQLMDNFSYYYPNSGSNNRLANVLDSSFLNLAGVEDLKRHIPTVPNLQRMLYDADGNLVKDLTSATDTVKWNIYGKTTDLLNNTAKLNLHYVYDGAGQRVSKNQMITTDTGNIYQNTYYVRDATGNILAEYNSKKVYGRGGPLVKVNWLNDVALDRQVLIDALYTTPVAQDATFISAVMDLSSSQPLLHSAGRYLLGNAPLLQQFLNNNATAVFPALAQYAAATGRHPLGDVTMLAVTNGNEQQLATIADKLSTQTEGLGSHIIDQLVSTLPQAFYRAATQLGYDQINNPDDSLLVLGQMAAILANDKTYLPGIIAAIYDDKDNDQGKGKDGEPEPVTNAPNAVTPWVNAVTSDPAYFTAGGNGTIPFSDLLGMYQDNLLNYGLGSAIHEALQSASPGTYVPYTGVTDPKDVGLSADTAAAHGIYGFADFLPGSMDMLNNLAGIRTLEEGVYTVDARPYLREVSVTFPSLLDDALDVMGETLDIDMLYNQVATIASVRNLPVGVKPVRLGTDEAVLKRQQVGLASHHIYGSSRLGVASYWPDQYARRWDYTTGVVDTSRLSAGVPWYSGSYNDVIEGSSTSPYGFGLQNGTALAQHLLGQKQYELANQLGNVQATVSDKRYTKQVSYGLLFQPGIVAAYDYYPFGMLMPGRWVSDASARSASVSTTMMVPAVTSVSVPAGWSYTTGTYGGYAYADFTTQQTTVNVTPGVAISLWAKISYIAAGNVTYTASELVNGVWVVRRSVLISSANNDISTALSFAPTTGVVQLKLKLNVPANTAIPMNSVVVSGVERITSTQVSQNVVTLMNNGVKDKYEFGFNGQMKDNEIAGTGNHNTALFWEYDTRTARRWNVDPKPFPSLSLYSVLKNNPILFPDPNGDIISVKIQESINGQSVLTTLKYDYKEVGGYGFYRPDGTFYEGGNFFAKQVSDAIGRIMLTPTGFNLGIGLINNSKIFEIDPARINSTNKDGYVNWNPYNTKGGFNENGNRDVKPWIGLAHEFGHVESIMKGTFDGRPWVNREDANGETIMNDEIRASHIENKIRAENGMSLRTHYGIGLQLNQAGGTDEVPMEETKLLKRGSTESIHVDQQEEIHVNGYNGQSYEYKK